MAKERGGVTLEMTMREKGVPFPSIAEDAPWDILAREFAKGVSGEVTVFLNPSKTGPRSCWSRVELPALKENPKVTKITEIDVTTGKATVTFQR